LTDAIGPIERSPAVRIARSALAGPAWVVGGPVRDAFLDRPVDADVDIVVTEDAAAAARQVADAGDAHLFPLSERFGAWRVMARDHSWQTDITPLRGGTIEADLAMRDFTVNAMARPLADTATLLDPHHGEADLERRVLRAVGEGAFEDDPLRVLRLARFAAELGLEVEGRTASLAQVSAPRIDAVAAERSYYELRRLIGGDDPLTGIRLVEELGLLAHLLPELQGLIGVEQNP